MLYSSIRLLVSVSVLIVALLMLCIPVPGAATVTHHITYQGHLNDPDGQPVDGSTQMRFRVFDDETNGTELYDTDFMAVNVREGVFSIDLDIPQSVFQGQARWLQIDVAGFALSPRQEITPAPYALGLRPGARVQQVATGTALRADSTEGIGFAGLGQVYGVYGVATGPQVGSGYGGYFESSTGIGVHGRSSAARSAQNAQAPGVHGWSQHGTGVFGESDASFGTGVRGQVATGNAVYGRASGGFGILGTSPAFAVRGFNAASTAGEGYGGYFSSTTGTGVYGETTAMPSSENNLPAGVRGRSQNGAGIVGEAGNNVAWAGYFRGRPGTPEEPAIESGHVRIDGSLVVRDSIFADDKSGYVFDFALNDDSEPLASGDVVVMTGFSEDRFSDRIPVAKVRLARDMEDSAVMGVVDRRRTESDNGIPAMVEEPAHPGDHVGVVTLGAFHEIKVDAGYGAISPGDLLVSSPNPGHAMRSDHPAPGTIIGKALGELDAGTGSIPVMVTLH